MKLLWTPNQDWGNETFVADDGQHYRRSRSKETPHLEVPTDFGPIGLRKLSRKEKNELDYSLAKTRGKIS